MRYKLFVYGTLKRGLANHSLLSKARYLGKRWTRERYPLVAPKRWYPYLIDAPGEGEHVAGELYEVDLPTLKMVDRLEEVPRYYRREVIEVVDGEGRVEEAFAYFLAHSIPYRQFPFLPEFPPKEE
ncbi:MAG: gamma-glutamylcyclotransferase [Epsilonproteobacteria bacterium]|nr:gamma-glutamylcyclotransferase [Campylobacterota bacterium]NPA56701.1 gamma-glutamylcyclotransferase [Campylobacterota bacterium]